MKSVKLQVLLGWYLYEPIECRAAITVYGWGAMETGRVEKGGNDKKKFGNQ